MPMSIDHLCFNIKLCKLYRRQTFLEQQKPQLWKFLSLFHLLQDCKYHLNCDWNQDNLGISLKLLNIWLFDLLAQILCLQLGKGWTTHRDWDHFCNSRSRQKYQNYPGVIRTTLAGEEEINFGPLIRKHILDINLHKG